MAKKQSNGKKVTRYTHEGAKEARSPETGHTPLLPTDEQVVSLPMDNGWSKAIEVAKLPEDDRTVVIDMDPAADPVLFWAGKRSKRSIPVLPLQRNEVVTESRIGHIIKRAQDAAAQEEMKGTLFADLERHFREGDKNKRVHFFTHSEGWKNKLICGDSLYVMESLLHYEGLHGRVQMVYIDPPYGIDYDSNFQQRMDSLKNEEKDQADDILTIKAFNDIWMLGIHSYLSYLHERLYLLRELLADTGSLFFQISLVNVHLVRAILDEVFGRSSYVSEIAFMRAAGRSAAGIDDVYDVILWYAKCPEMMKHRPIFRNRTVSELSAFDHVETEDGEIIQLSAEQLEGKEPVPDGRRLMYMDFTGQDETEGGAYPIQFEGSTYYPRKGRHWSTNADGTDRLIALGRVGRKGQNIFFKRYADDFPLRSIWNIWTDTVVSGFRRGHEKHYVVDTPAKAIERCMLMTSDPGDLTLDPTCGGGTTAYCAEKLGRRWITCDTSRVAINRARRRLLCGLYEHYTLRNGTVASGFVYKTEKKLTRECLAHDLEPEKVDLVDQPEPEKNAVRVTGPFEVLTLGRYAPEDWKGYVNESGVLENYIVVICRLYRKDAAIQGHGFVHAVIESEQERIAISVGPISGRVTAKQINDAVQDALALGVLEVHVLGWAFEANVGEIKSHLESRGKVKILLVMIRPDTLAEGLKITRPDMLFSPLALPDVEVTTSNGKGEAKEVTVTLKGVGVFDRKERTTDYYRGNSGYVAAWYLDEDYDGDCFVDAQMFFDFAKAPNLKSTLKLDVGADEFKLRLTSDPFPVRGYKRIAVKVVDVYGNESTVVKNL